MTLADPLSYPLDVPNFTPGKLPNDTNPRDGKPYLSWISGKE
jgi:hypothetical protein